MSQSMTGRQRWKSSRRQARREERCEQRPLKKGDLLENADGTDAYLLFLLLSCPFNFNFRFWAVTACGRWTSIFSDGHATSSQTTPTLSTLWSSSTLRSVLWLLPDLLGLADLLCAYILLGLVSSTLFSTLTTD